MSDELLSKINKVIVEKLGVTEDKVKPEAAFVEDLGADSLDQVELVMALEDEFDITVEEEELADIKTVGQALAMVEGKVGA